jgi:Tfp pilus assembly PilM family ATPase
MELLTIDLGTYSVKFLHGSIERKQFRLIDATEILMSEVAQDFSDEATIEEMQLEIIRHYLEGIDQRIKIIYPLASDMMTTRFLTLPVSNRRKAEAMVPFQLEEILPYPLNTLHYQTQLKKINMQHYCLVSITQIEEFDGIHHLMTKKNVKPAILTSEISIIQSFAQNFRPKESCCIIDMGHVTTKVYFINNQTVISNHTSYIAGSTLDDAISTLYKTSPEEAIIFKHNNCFVINDDQVESLEEDQREFAKFMNDTLKPFVDDLRRFELGHRVHTGKPIETIYLSGGSGQIKNLGPYLSRELTFKVVPFRPDKLAQDYFSQKDLKLNEEEKQNFATPFMMAANQFSNTPMINMLSGNYSSDFSQSIPLHSGVFVTARAVFLSLVILIGLTVEKVWINTENKQIDLEIIKIINSETLGLTPQEQKRFRKKPDQLSQTLIKKNRQIKQEVSTLQAATKINAIGSLSELSQILSSNVKVTMLSFISEAGQAQAKFKSNDLSELEAMQSQLQKSALKDLQSQLDRTANILVVKFSGSKF